MTENKRKIVTEMRELKQNLERHLQKLEKNIFDMETCYIEESENCGNILEGFEQSLGGKTKGLQKSTFALQKKQRVSANKRLFSKSSIGKVPVGTKDENTLFNFANKSSENLKRNHIHYRKKYQSSLNRKRRHLSSTDYEQGSQ